MTEGKGDEGDIDVIAGLSSADRRIRRKAVIPSKFYSQKGRELTCEDKELKCSNFTQARVHISMHAEVVNIRESRTKNI